MSGLNRIQRHARLQKTYPPSLLLVDAYTQAPFIQPDPHAPQVLNLASLLPAATTGDLIVLIVCCSSLATGPITIPSGYTKDQDRDQGSFEALTICHGAYASSISFEVPINNSEIRHLVYAFRNYDPTTPVTVPSIVSDLANNTHYASGTLPSGKNAYLICTATRGAPQVFPKPSLIDDASTTTAPPVTPPTNRPLYGFSRPIPVGTTSPFDPGQVNSDGLSNYLLGTIVVNGL